MIRVSQVLALTFWACTAAHSQSDTALRVFGVEDLLALEQVEDVVMSPLGDRAAVTLVPSLTDCSRPAAGGRAGYNTHYWRTQACSEIHIATGSGFTRVAGSDTRGYFAPRWSPSGERLAFLSLDHDGDVHIWIWRESEKPVQVTAAPIDPEFSAWNSNTQVWTWSPFDWIGDNEIVTALADRTAFDVKRTPIVHPGEVLESGWAAQAQGERSTADPLYAAPSQMDFPSVSLVRIDVESREVKELARGAFRAVRLSPKTSVAMVSEVISDVSAVPTKAMGQALRYRTPKALSSLYAHTRVGVLNLDDGASVAWFDEVFDMTVSWFTPQDRNGRSAGFIAPQPVWNDDGSKIVFLGNTEAKLHAAPTVFVYDTDAEKLTSTNAGGATVVSLAWVGNTPLFAQIVPEIAGDSPCVTTWCIAGGQAQNAFVPGQLPKDEPRVLYPVGGNAAWYVHDGDVWAWTASSRTLRNIANGQLGTVRSIEAVASSLQASTGIVKVDRPSGRERIAVVYDDNSLTDLGPLGQAEGLSLGAAEISTTGRPEDLALFKLNTSDGIRIWVQAGHDGELHELAWLNSHLTELAQGATMPLYYEGRRGKDLSGFLVLPPSRREGEQLPLVTYVYPNWMGAEGTPQHSSTVNSRFFMNRHLLTSAGYAVLVPFIPTEPPHEATPLCEQIADAVLPAIDAAVETGYIDQNAIGVMGHSYGGYTAASLMTCTDRFNAGLAVSGFYNLASYPLNLKHRDRYNGHALGALSGFAEVESVGPSKLFQFDHTPWSNLDPYIHNSPVFHLDNLSAPLMVVHGELDGVPMEQAEQMYVAARRLQKNIVFIRYWGEYHNFYSPANIRDFWERTIDFFDENMVEARVAEADARHLASRTP